MNFEFVKLILYVSAGAFDEDCDDKEDEYIEAFSESDYQFKKFKQIGIIIFSMFTFNKQQSKDVEDRVRKSTRSRVNSSQCE